MINTIETSVESPVCPHCETKLINILCRQVSSMFGKRYIYFCSECKKVLGITQRKGFWMG